MRTVSLGGAGREGAQIAGDMRCHAHEDSLGCPRHTRGWLEGQGCSRGSGEPCGLGSQVGGLDLGLWDGGELAEVSGKGVLETRPDVMTRNSLSAETCCPLSPLPVDYPAFGKIRGLQRFLVLIQK